LLDAIVERDGCRFISRQEGIDSENELIWHAIRPLFTYFANVFSRNLSDKIKRGIETKRQNGSYRGGRPVKRVDVEKLRLVRLAHPEAGWRKLTGFYNEGLPNRQQVSFSLLRRVYQKLSFNGQHENTLN
jgi:DNA invertase Pin-like site-specific DNA recombinase